MDSEIIATLIHENEQGNIKNETLLKENDTLSEEIQALCQDLRTLNQDNKELRQENELIKRRLADEEEISIVLSKRIELVEQDFRRYVEKNAVIFVL